MRKLRALLAALLLVVCGGCGRITSDTRIFRYDIAEPVENLDPQFSTGATARMIIGNIYEGLVTRDPNGNILPGAAESHTVSSDGLRYTFTMREDAAWSDSAALTSADFLFSFQRLFGAGSHSPYAADYLCIKNAYEILAGNLPVSKLGVSAPDSKTLVFELDNPNPFFLELLGEPPAMPCNEEFFSEARGRYGLEMKFVRANGPFVLDKWDNKKYILLRENTAYRSERAALASGVNLYIGRESAVDLFLDGKSDVTMVPYERLPDLQNKGAGQQSFEKTTWCIVFNQRDKTLGNPLIRQALAYTVEHENLTESLTPNFTPSGVYIPPAMQLLDQSYRDAAGDKAPLGFDTQRGKYLLELGLDAMETSTLPPITMYVPDTDVHHLCMGQIQQGWQKHLGAYIDVEAVSAAQIESRLRSGDYQMLLMPFSPASGRVQSMLDVFASTSGQNYTGYHNPWYDSLLLDAMDEGTVEEAAKKYCQAEMLLLLDAVVLPVYFETTAYAFAEGVQGIEVSPYAGSMYFKYAQRG